MMTAHLDNEASLNSLGFPLADTLSPLADPDNPNSEYFYAAAEKPIIDHAQKARALAEDAWRKANDGDLPSYVHFPVQRYERPR